LLNNIKVKNDELDVSGTGIRGDVADSAVVADVKVPAKPITSEKDKKEKKEPEKRPEHKKAE